VTQASSGGDILVAYLLVVGNNVTTTRIDDCFGLGRDATELHGKAHEDYMASHNPNHFEAGTLVVDLLDARTFKLLWRRQVSRPVLRDLAEEARRERLQEVVAEAFRELKIAS
jgi:hypothetical protein